MVGIWVDDLPWFVPRILVNDPLESLLFTLGFNIRAVTCSRFPVARCVYELLNALLFLVFRLSFFVIINSLKFAWNVFETSSCIFLFIFYILKNTFTNVLLVYCEKFYIMAFMQFSICKIQGITSMFVTILNYIHREVILPLENQDQEEPVETEISFLKSVVNPLLYLIFQFSIFRILFSILFGSSKFTLDCINYLSSMIVKLRMDATKVNSEINSMASFSMFFHIFFQVLTEIKIIKNEYLDQGFEEMPGEGTSGKPSRKRLHEEILSSDEEYEIFRTCENIDYNSSLDPDYEPEVRSTTDTAEYSDESDTNDIINGEAQMPEEETVAEITHDLRSENEVEAIDYVREGQEHE